MGNNFVKTTRLFSAEAVVAGGSSTSAAIDLRNIAQLGYFSIQLVVTGDGTAKVEYLCSNNNSVFIEPSGASDIVTEFTKASGPSINGKGFYSFYPETCGWMKFKVTETGGSSAIAVTLDVAIQ
jgi:hypothetical protein